MKKLALLGTLVAALAVGAVWVSAALAFDQQSTGFTCNVFDENGGLFSTTQSSDTLYFSGKEQLHCTGTSPSGGNGTFVTYSGFACGLVFTGVSVNPANKDTVSKTGYSQLSCWNDGFSSPASAASVGAAG